LCGIEKPWEFALPGVTDIAGADKFNFPIVNTFGDHGEFRVGNLKAKRMNLFASGRDIDRVELPQIFLQRSVVLLKDHQLDRASSVHSDFPTIFLPQLEQLS
jgi:hypothetical protein